MALGDGYFNCLRQVATLNDPMLHQPSNQPNAVFICMREPLCWNATRVELTMVYIRDATVDAFASCQTANIRLY